MVDGIRATSILLRPPPRQPGRAANKGSAQATESGLHQSERSPQTPVVIASPIGRILQARMALARLGRAKRLFNGDSARLAWRLVRLRGLRVLARHGYAKLRVRQGYAQWARRHEPTAADLEDQRRYLFQHPCRFSIIVPAYNTPPAYLCAMIDSVLNQSYPSWELCIADGNSADPQVREILQRYRHADRRIRLRILSSNLGIAGNSNAALAMATGDFIALLDHDDLLAPFALYEMARAIEDHPGVDFLYSDEDKVTPDGRWREQHNFKPDWSPDTLRSQNYITHLSVIRASLVQGLQGFRDGFDGSQDYDLILRATEQARKVVHIPKVLYHWRAHSQSVAGNETAKLYAYEAGKRALQDHLQRSGVDAQVEFGVHPGVYHVRYAIPDSLRVSIIIHSARQRSFSPTRPSTIRTGYPNVELIALSDPARPPGGTGVARLHSVAERLNAAAARAGGEVLVFLNADALPRRHDWLQGLLEQVVRPEVGAVGAKLCAEDGSIWHAGVILGLTGIAGHPHRHFAGSARGYASRLTSVQNVSAVSGACLGIRRPVFEAVGGFDRRYRSSYHDLDLCLRLQQRELRTVWTPYSELTYRPKGCPLGSAMDADQFRQRWGHLLEAGDPYYNPNLSLDWEDFSLAI